MCRSSSRSTTPEWPTQSSTCSWPSGWWPAGSARARWSVSTGGRVHVSTRRSGWCCSRRDPSSLRRWSTQSVADIPTKHRKSSFSSSSEVRPTTSSGSMTSPRGALGELVRPALGASVPPCPGCCRWVTKNRQMTGGFCIAAVRVARCNVLLKGATAMTEPDRLLIPTPSPRDPASGLFRWSGGAIRTEVPSGPAVGESTLGASGPESSGRTDPASGGRLSQLVGRQGYPPAGPPRSSATEPDVEVALLDRVGVIVAVNAAWDAFCNANGGDPTRMGIGASYLEARAAAVGDPVADGACAGLQIRRTDAHPGRVAPVGVAERIPCGVHRHDDTDAIQQRHLDVGLGGARPRRPGRWITLPPHQLRQTASGGRIRTSAAFGSARAQGALPYGRARRDLRTDGAA